MAISINFANNQSAHSAATLAKLAALRAGKTYMDTSPNGYGPYIEPSIPSVSQK